VQDGVIPDCDGLDIALVSDVPLGAGLSSSAALECSVALAACELSLGRAPEAAETAHLVTVCMRAENEVVGASTGGLDQRSSFYGADGEALAVDFLRDTVDLVPCDLESAGLALLIINTNAPHRLADGQYASRRGVVDAVGRVAGHGTVGASLPRIPEAKDAMSSRGLSTPGLYPRRQKSCWREIWRSGRPLHTGGSGISSARSTARQTSL
jgi:galactokinase